MSEMLQRQSGEAEQVPWTNRPEMERGESAGALDQLEARLESLGQTIDLLEFKLAGVLHQQYSEAEPALRVEPGTRLAGAVARLETLTGMVRSIADRVDL